jgi:hypothetical protein
MPPEQQDCSDGHERRLRRSAMALAIFALSVRGVASIARAYRSSPNAQLPIRMATGSATASHKTKPSANTVRTPAPKGVSWRTQFDQVSPISRRQFHVIVYRRLPECSATHPGRSSRPCQSRPPERRARTRANQLSISTQVTPFCSGGSSSPSRIGTTCSMRVAGQLRRTCSRRNHSAQSVLRRCCVGRLAACCATLLATRAEPR